VACGEIPTRADRFLGFSNTFDAISWSLMLLSGVTSISSDVVRHLELVFEGYRPLIALSLSQLVNGVQISYLMLQ